MTGDTLQRAELQHAFSRISSLEAELQQAREELAEARRLAQWTPITPENLPKKGHLVLTLYRGDWSVDKVLSDWTVEDVSADDSPCWIIAPPEVKP